MRNKQDASGGDNSTVNQAGGDVNLSTTINYGMGYTETKDLFMDLFHIDSTFAAQNRQVHLNIIGQTRKPLL